LLRIKLYPAPAFLFFLIFTYDASAQSQDQRTEVVNQQLNMFESSRWGADGASKEFSNAQPEEQSAGTTLKSFLSPDLSETPKPKVPSNVITRVHSLDIGSEISYYRYEEPDLGVKIFGPMYGFYADYAYRPADPNFFNNFLTNVYMLQARYAMSYNLDYKGSGTFRNKHDDVMEFRGLIGKDYFIGTDLRVTPYIGFGYRYLFDRGNGEITSSNNYLYDRKSQYYYLPLGGDVVREMPNNWEIDFNAEYDILLRGQQNSFLNDGNQFGFNNPEIVNHQHHGFGLRGSVKFLKRGPVVDFYVEPYVRFWNIEQSSVVTAFVDGSLGQWVEPKNNTTEVGSRFGIQF